ncbi:MAG TPA: indole-3-glycerol phosphate synthase TrpC [Vicinamibacterales bacterium]|nr:indole-3-glycerol phosphate synthase TrpC [Vicinamibacterales bacterium]
MAPPADLLATIVAATRRAVEFRQSVCSIAELERQTVRVPQGTAFVDALRLSPAPRIIAECKRRSPSKGILRARYEPAVHAASYAGAGAAAISVLTEPTFFDGSPDDLRAVRSAVAIPVLRKDFIVTDYQVHEAAALGADAVLLIAGALDDAALTRLLGLATARGLAALVEVHDGAELARAVDAGAGVIGVNSRNLRTLTVDHDVLERVAGVWRRSKPDAAAVLVAESGIRTGEDLRRLSLAGYEAFLVGERLITQPDPGAALRELRAS